MFAHERLNEIINILNKEGKVVVKNLSGNFNITEDCIRKDLRNLEKQNLLRRTYGGAVPISHDKILTLTYLRHIKIILMVIEISP